MATKKATKLKGRGGAGRGQGRKRMLDEAIRTTISVFLTPAEKAEVDDRARAEGLSRSSYVRKALGFPPVE
jgi:hypothetical protein